MPVPAPSVTPGWRLVRIGVEGDDVDVDGVNPWSLAAWGAPLGTIVVAHPSYPAQRHIMSIYRPFRPGGGPVEFAAGEFSNGVWGIFQRLRGADVVS
ncbi:MAG: hypothetical protein U0Q15_11635 [Kineosporiaceae bacterium]